MKKKGLKTIIKDLFKENEIPRVKPTWDVKKGLKSNLPKPTAVNKPKVKSEAKFVPKPSSAKPLGAMEVKYLLLKELSKWNVWDNPEDKKDIYSAINNAHSISDLLVTLDELGFDDPAEFLTKSITKMK